MADHSESGYDHGEGAQYQAETDYQPAETGYQPAEPLQDSDIGQPATDSDLVAPEGVDMSEE